MTNIVYRNVSGSGLWYAIVAAGNGNSVTSNIAITDGTYDGSSSSNAIASIGVGDVTYGGQTSNSLNTRNITLSNLTLSGIWNQAVRTVGTVKGLNLSNNTVGPPRSSNLPLIEIQGTTGSIISYNELTTLGNDAIAVGTVVGASNLTSNPIIRNNTIAGVPSGKIGINLKNVDGAIVEGNLIVSAASAVRAIGISLAKNPNGTTNATVTGNNLMTALPQIVCAIGQHNIVTRNTGASDCP